MFPEEKVRWISQPTNKYLEKNIEIQPFKNQKDKTETKSTFQAHEKKNKFPKITITTYLGNLFSLKQVNYNLKRNEGLKITLI